jgi:hypothetical protein
MQPVIPLQATISGLAANSKNGGDTVFAAFDVASGLVVVDAVRTLPAGGTETRRDHAAVVTNNSACEDFDLLFTEADLRDAINDYYALSGRGLLHIESGVARLDPATMLEPDGVDEKGRKYRIAPGIGNGHLAVIVLCWFAARQGNFSRQIAAFDEYSDLNVSSVGLPDREVFGYAMGGMLPLGRDGWPL